MPTLRPYDPHRKVEILGDFWIATRKNRTLTVEVRTHPMGWEVRGLVGLEIHRSAVARTEADLFATVEQWKAEAIDKGWILTSPA